jgi:hypothetical protein
MQIFGTEHGFPAPLFPSKAINSGFADLSIGDPAYRADCGQSCLSV